MTVDLRWGASRMLVVDGVEVHVEEAGPGLGEEVVCLHGFSSGTFTWAGIAPDLCDDARVVAWDRPPFGRSGRPRPHRGPEDPYSLDADLARARAVVDDAGHGIADDGESIRPRRVVVGHSAGASLAVSAVLAGAIAADALVLLAPAGDGGPPPAVRTIARLPGASRVGPTMVRAALRGAGATLRAAGRHPNPLTTATASASASALRRAGTAEALWHLTAHWHPAGIADLDPSGLPPTVVVTGADDRIVQPAAQAALAAHLGARHLVLDGVGHAPQEQRPADVVAVIRELLAGD